jgi:hypothetical protein
MAIRRRASCHLKFIVDAQGNNNSLTSEQGSDQSTNLSGNLNYSNLAPLLAEGRFSQSPGKGGGGGGGKAVQGNGPAEQGNAPASVVEFADPGVSSSVPAPFKTYREPELARFTR